MERETETETESETEREREKIAYTLMKNVLCISLIGCIKQTYIHTYTCTKKH